VPNADWIPAERGLVVLCDATSACAMAVEFAKLDVVTWSWQKVLGGEAAHGMLALSPRAIARLESYRPPRPLPKVFRLTRNGALDGSIFEGSTINTPSMLCVEDALDGLAWAERIGGLPALIRRSESNLATVAEWVARTDWVDFLAKDPRTRSCTSICLAVVDPAFAALDGATRAGVIKKMAALARAGRRSARRGELSRCAARAAALGRRHGRAQRSGGRAAVARLGLERHAAGLALRQANSSAVPASPSRR
jgi:phosphoserine aminotransferase